MSSNDEIEDDREDSSENMVDSCDDEVDKARALMTLRKLEN